MAVLAPMLHVDWSLKKKTVAQLEGVMADENFVRHERPWSVDRGQDHTAQGAARREFGTMAHSWRLEQGQSNR